MSEPRSDVLDCGKTVGEVSDYLAADRTPYDPEIETCPECLNVLDALARLGALSRTLLDSEAQSLPAPPEGWFGRIMHTVRSEMRSGRSLPVHHPDPRVRITITEGAVRSLVRAVGDTIDGLYVGHVGIEGDAQTPGTPVRVALTATAAWNRSLPALAAQLRAAVRDALAQHTELNVAAVDVTVEDLHGWTTTGDAS